MSVFNYNLKLNMSDGSTLQTADAMRISDDQRCLYSNRLLSDLTFQTGATNNVISLDPFSRDYGIHFINGAVTIHAQVDMGVTCLLLAGDEVLASAADVIDASFEKTIMLNSFCYGRFQPKIQVYGWPVDVDAVMQDYSIKERTTNGDGGYATFISCVKIGEIIEGDR